MINYYIKTELTEQRTVYLNAEFTSGDVGGYRFNFTFFDNGKQISPAKMTLLVKAKRADGVIVTDMGTTDVLSAYYDVKSSMISVCGEVAFEIAASDGVPCNLSADGVVSAAELTRDRDVHCIKAYLKNDPEVCGYAMVKFE